MTPLVLLHAFPFDAALFAPQRAGLPDLTILTPNLIGFGDQPAKRPVSMADQADHIVAILDKHGIEKAIIGGVSMGGYVSLALLNQHPNRVAGLILADTRADGDDETAKANRAKAIATVETDGVAALVDLQLPRLLGESTRTSSPDVVQTVREIAVRQSSSGVVAAIEMLRDRPDWTATLPRIHVPTLIIVGEDDVVTPPKLSQAMRAAIPGSTLVTIPQAGHLANIEQLAAFNAAVRAFADTLRK